MPPTEEFDYVIVGAGSSGCVLADRLTEDEWALVRRHPSAGAEMLAAVDFPWDVRPIVESHHECWDGSGYPHGLAGERIPLAARIVCACDAWSAMTTDRSYRKARPAAEAGAELRASSGTHFDPRVVDALLFVLDA